MKTRIRFDNGKYAGANWDDVPFESAKTFEVSWQREAAYKWARTGIGDAALFVDVVTSVEESERPNAVRIECRCGKVLQNGAGKLHDGLCGACCKATWIKVMGRQAA